MKFAHIADTHIRNLKFHKEYRVVFEKIYKKLRDLKVDYIIHCGDIAHTKTQLSPEFVEMCTNFLKNLADIAPTYIILGNHDGNLRNSGRQDALTPIVQALDHPDLYLLKNSQEINLNKNFTINVLSVFDRKNWNSPTDMSKINVALYHGAISGVTTDTGWRMRHGEDDFSVFDNFDYAFLGDIHKTNQTLDTEGKIRYPGSTIQQNHGETNDKGFLVWDIKDKNSFTCAHHIIENPKPFISLVLTPKGRLPSKLKITPLSRIRLVSENNLPLGVIRKAVAATKTRFKPESVTYLSRAMGETGNVENLTNSLVQEDLRNIAVQENLIKEYLLDFQPSKEILEEAFNINRKYNTLVEEEEEVKRNINWRMKLLEWDNLFNYGEKNSINFENLDGIVGILGKNFSGKSSIIDALLYTVYNTTSKQNRKNVNIINQNKDNCRGYVEIDIGTKTYKIERTSEKYKKKLKGKETTEAKTNLDFKVYDHTNGEERELNGLSRIDTDSNIRKIFGTIEDFLITSMASQLGSLSYISEGSTRRKEILAKFLDLEIFERKFKKVKEDSLELKVALKKLSGREFSIEKDEARTELARQSTLLMLRERECNTSEQEIKTLFEKQNKIVNKIDSLPTEIIDIQTIKNDISKFANQLTIQLTHKRNKKDELQKEKDFLEKIENFVRGFNIEAIREKKEVLDDHKDKIAEFEEELAQLEDQKKLNEEKIKLLKSTPCNISLYEKCPFIKGAYRAIEDTKRVEIGINQLALGKKTIIKKIKNLKPNKVEEYNKKYEMILEKQTKQKNMINILQLDLEKNKSKIFQLESDLEKLRAKEKEYEDNKEAIENLEGLYKEKEKISNNLNTLEQKQQKQKKELLELYRSNGILEQKYNQVTDEEKQFYKLEKEYTAADLYMRCMHSNGISYDIIKKRLPLINDEISKVLTNIVDFEVFFENDEKKLDILIKHPEYDARTIEMCSGAEKTIAAMAIRLALLNVSTLPKGDVFILDEPGTALDAENMEGFVRILDMIKTQFKTVLLISHLDNLKDVVDQQIIIEKEKGYAHVEE
jgi:exonuclease SbcC